MDELTSRAAGFYIYTTADAISFFDQVPVDERDLDMTVIRTPLGLMQMTGKLARFKESEEHPANSADLFAYVTPVSDLSCQTKLFAVLSENEISHKGSALIQNYSENHVMKRMMRSTAYRDEAERGKMEGPYQESKYHKEISARVKRQLGTLMKAH
ncbi:hypothetical protein HDU77_001657 [Chytriomyces hyalinus]|nr:hypothetical protein HDU77_001657 [Chytriomyces hyalinus]